MDIQTHTVMDKYFAFQKKIRCELILVASTSSFPSSVNPLVIKMTCNISL